MLEDLISYLESGAGEGFSHHQAAEALAAVMAVASRADGVVRQSERDCMAQLLSENFDITSDQAADIAKRATCANTADTSLAVCIAILSNYANRAPLTRLMADLRRIALSDGEFHAFEADLMDGIGQLLRPRHN